MGAVFIISRYTTKWKELEIPICSKESQKKRCQLLFTNDEVQDSLRL